MVRSSRAACARPSSPTWRWRATTSRSPAIERSGVTTASTFAFLINVDTGARVWPNSTTGVARVAKGRYVLSGSVQSSTGAYTHDVINYPNLTVSGATTIDLDARQAKPVKVTLPVAAQLSLLQTGFERVVNGTAYTIGNFSVGGSVDAPRRREPRPGLERGHRQDRDVLERGPDFYGLAWYQKGSTLQRPRPRRSPRRTSRPVKVDIPPLKTGPERLDRPHRPHPHGRADWTYGSLDNFAPGQRTEYYGGEGGDWSRRFNLFDETGNIGVRSSPRCRHYRAGQVLRGTVQPRGVRPGAARDARTSRTRSAPVTSSGSRSRSTATTRATRATAP